MKRLLFGLGISALLVACSAFTSSTGEPGDADAGSGADASGGDASPEAEAPDGAALADSGTNDARTLSDGETYFVTNVYPSVLPTCGASCHNAGAGSAAGLPCFGMGAAATYVRFKQFGYAAKPSTSNAFVTKGVHAGPALTAGQLQTFEAWLALEP